MAKDLDLSLRITAVDRASRTLQRISDRVSGVGRNRGLERLQQRADAISRSLGRAGASITAKITAPLLGVGGMGLYAAGEIEKMETQFESLLGSSAAAKRMVQDLTHFTATTPFQLGGVGEAAKQLLAFGVAEDEVMDKLRFLGDVAAGSGKPLADLTQIYGKVIDRQKAMTEELDQLGAAGIPITGVVSKLLSERLGQPISRADVRRGASAGLLTAELFEEALRSMSEEGGIFENQMEKQSNTLFGLFSTLKDNVFLATAEIGQQLEDTFAVKGTMRDLTEWIQSLTEKFRIFREENPELADLFTKIAGGLVVAGPALIGLGLSIKGFSTAAGLFAATGPIGIIILGLGALAALGLKLKEAFGQGGFFDITEPFDFELEATSGSARTSIPSPGSSAKWRSGTKGLSDSAIGSGAPCARPWGIPLRTSSLARTWPVEGSGRAGRDYPYACHAGRRGRRQSLGWLQDQWDKLSFGNLTFSLPAPVEDAWGWLQDQWDKLSFGNLTFSLPAPVEDAWGWLQDQWDKLSFGNLTFSLPAPVEDAWGWLQDQWDKLSFGNLTFSLPAPVEDAWGWLQDQWDKLSFGNLTFSLPAPVEDAWGWLQDQWDKLSFGNLTFSLPAPVEDAWGWLQDQWDKLSFGNLTFSLPAPVEGRLGLAPGPVGQALLRQPHLQPPGPRRGRLGLAPGPVGQALLRQPHLQPPGPRRGRLGLAPGPVGQALLRQPHLQPPGPRRGRLGLAPGPVGQALGGRSQDRGPGDRPLRLDRGSVVAAMAQSRARGPGHSRRYRDRLPVRQQVRPRRAGPARRRKRECAGRRAASAAAAGAPDAGPVRGRAVRRGISAGQPPGRPRPPRGQGRHRARPRRPAQGFEVQDPGQSETRTSTST